MPNRPRVDRIQSRKEPRPISTANTWAWIWTVVKWKASLSASRSVLRCTQEESTDCFISSPRRTRRGSSAGQGAAVPLPKPQPVPVKGNRRPKIRRPNQISPATEGCGCPNQWGKIFNSIHYISLSSLPAVDIRQLVWNISYFNYYYSYIFILYTSAVSFWLQSRVLSRLWKDFSFNYFNYIITVITIPPSAFIFWTCLSNKWSN